MLLFEEGISHTMCYFDITKLFTSNLYDIRVFFSSAQMQILNELGRFSKIKKGFQCQTFGLGEEVSQGL